MNKNVGCVYAGKLQTHVRRVQTVGREMVQRAPDDKPPTKKLWTSLSGHYTAVATTSSS